MRAFPLLLGVTIYNWFIEPNENHFYYSAALTTVVGATDLVWWAAKHFYKRFAGAT